MKSAFALEAEKPQLLDIVHLGERTRRVPVTDGQIALFPQRVIGKPVRFEVLTHIPVGPVENRMDLVLTALELDGDRSAPACLPVTAAIRENQVWAPSSFNARSIGSFLFHAIVELDTFDTLIPQFAETRFLPCRRRLRAVDLEIEIEFRGQLIDEAVGFGGRDSRYRSVPPECPAQHRWTRCSITADWAPKLDESTWVPGRSSSACCTRWRAVRPPNDPLKRRSSLGRPRRRRGPTIEPTLLSSSCSVLYDKAGDTPEPSLAHRKRVTFESKAGSNPVLVGKFMI